MPKEISMTISYYPPTVCKVGEILTFVFPDGSEIKKRVSKVTSCEEGEKLEVENVEEKG